MRKLNQPIRTDTSHRRRILGPAGFTLTSLLALGANAAPPGDVTLTVPHPPHPGEQMIIAVSIGPIGHHRIEVTTPTGQRLGTISQFGVQAGRSGGTFLLPVPPGAVQDGKLALHLTITGNGESRPPTPEEVTGVTLSLAPP